MNNVIVCVIETNYKLSFKRIIIYTVNSVGQKNRRFQPKHPKWIILQSNRTPNSRCTNKYIILCEYVIRRMIVQENKPGCFRIQFFSLVTAAMEDVKSTFT